MITETEMIVLSGIVAVVGSVIGFFLGWAMAWGLRRFNDGAIRRNALREAIAIADRRAEDCVKYAPEGNIQVGLVKAMGASEVALEITRLGWKS